MIEPKNYKKDFSIHRDKIYELVNDIVLENSGSFSAEHGIGMIKRKYLLKYKSKNEIKLMKNIKESFDPKNILNPNKIF